MDVTTGEYEVALVSRSLDDPGLQPARCADRMAAGRGQRRVDTHVQHRPLPRESGDLDNADWLWGYERVDLKTGETESRDFGPLEVVLFTGMRRPGHLDKMYGVLTQLKEFDVPSQTETRNIELEHTYYCVNFSTDGSRLYLSGRPQ